MGRVANPPYIIVAAGLGPARLVRADIADK